MSPTVSLFPEALRVEYDGHVVDAPERAAKAAQLRWALQAAGVWNAPRTILDVGCGAGLLLAALEAPGAFKIGCDVRAELYQQIKSDIQFVQASAETLPFAWEVFDLVFCVAVIEELSDWRGVLQYMARCVRRGGVLYVTFTNGPWLLRVYALVRRLGLRVPPSWQRYAEMSVRFARESPHDGMGVFALRGWRFVDVTPYLAQAHWRVLRILPRAFLSWLTRRFAPSFGYAWQKPNI